MMIWEPFEEISRMHDEIERMFSNFYGRHSPLLPGKEGKESKELTRTPVTGLKETANELIATFEIPGAAKEDISLNVTENSIEVRAGQKHEREEKGKDFYGYASTSRIFYRKLPLPVEVNAEETKAEYKEGLLRVFMPKTGAEGKKKKVEIK